MSFSLILPFLRPIEKFILDEEISEIMVNASGRVFVERLGQLAEIQGVTLEPKHLEVAVKNIARLLGDDISEEKPILDSRLPDGSRVAAMFPPCSVGGTTLTIRKFKAWFSVDELVQMGSLEQEMADALRRSIAARKNILISGGTGTGKTTLLSALASLIPDEERIIVVEDTAEIQLSKPDVVLFEARGPRPDSQPVTVRDLVKASLRHRPDRIIVGEVRGGEAFDLLQALNTGHAGSLSTIHANSTVHALSRLTNCVLESGVELPYAAIRANIAVSINLVVQIERTGTRRAVTDVLEIHRYNHAEDTFDLIPLGRKNGQEHSAPQPKPAQKSRVRFGGR
jgi:pilus assembly protein CpaF